MQEALRLLQSSSDGESRKLYPIRPVRLAEAGHPARGQIYFERPVQSRRRKIDGGYDVWRHSGGVKGATVFPESGAPVIRRQYGTVLVDREVVARFASYTMVADDGNPDRPVLYQIFPPGTRKPSKLRKNSKLDSTHKPKVRKAGRICRAKGKGRQIVSTA